MRRGAFTAAIVLGCGLPLLGLVVAGTRPGVRAVIHDFVSPTIDTVKPSPVPVALEDRDRDGGEALVGGAESRELRALRTADAGSPTTRTARDALFASPLATPTPQNASPRPRALRRSELASRDDASIDQATAYLATDEAGHRALLGALKGSGRYRDAVERILHAWRVPEELSAVAFVESGFSPTHRSKDGSVGLWSLPREVAQAYGLALLDTYDERRGVALSTEAAGHYLADLKERLGTWELALFAYGIGYRPALKALAASKSSDYWEMIRELPRDGTLYVTEVLATSTVLDNRGAFGLDAVRPDPPETTGDLEVPGSAPLLCIAQAAETTVQRLHELNPEYSGEVVPSTKFVMVMHVPSAGLAAAQEGLWPLLTSGGGCHDGEPDPGHGRRDGGSDAGKRGAKQAGPANAARPIYYRVVEGDTLESIAGRFRLPREAIIGDNALDPAEGLKPGQLLLLRAGAQGNP